jgi:hypothetical protein
MLDSPLIDRVCGTQTELALPLDSPAIRTIDTQSFGMFLLSLAPDVRRSRFGGFVSNDRLLAHARTAVRRDATVLGWVASGRVSAVAELYPFHDGVTGAADLALTFAQGSPPADLVVALFRESVEACCRAGRRTVYLSACAPGGAAATVADAMASLKAGRVDVHLELDA